MYLGDYLANETVYFMWSSNGADGASITRATNGTISVYKDANTTQTTTGVTDTEDFDSLTGVHHVAIATTDGFYTTATDFTVVLSGATIDGKTVNAVLAHFSIENRTQKADVTKWNGTAVATPATAGYPVVTHKVGTGTGELSLSSGRAQLQDGSITAATLAADAITAAKIAADAIGASELAADAVTEIQTALAASLVAIGLDHLLSASVAGSDIVDNSIIAKLVSKSGTADWDTFSNATDSLEALRDNQYGGTATVPEVTPGAEPATAEGLLRMIYNKLYRRGELTESLWRVYQPGASGGSSGVLTEQVVSDDGDTQIAQQATYPS